MNFDCCFTNQNHWFRYRTGGILLCDQKILFVKTNFGDYHYIIGGGVHMGETSERCIEREFFEETGLRVQVDHLAVVCENFFKGKGGTMEGMDCHTIEFYYALNLLDADISACRQQTDDGEKLVWLSLEDIPHSIIKPTFMKECLPQIINEKSPLHIVEERDR